jgi:transposase InsO family protein
LLPYGKVPDALTSHLLALQHRDAWCKERSWEALPESIVKEGPFRGVWSEDHAGLVRHDGAVYVPPDQATQREILRVNHDDPWQGGHFGQKRTLEVIQRRYWWVGLAKSVREYVETCDICQRMKAPRHKPYGTLVPLPQPERAWQDISLDFITGLPPAARRRKAYDAVLVVVDRFSKMVRYIACTTNIDAPEMAELLIEEIFSKFGTPRSIVSDRGTTFTSAFWSTLCYYLVVKRCVSTAFHPQTDGQTERVNQTLECYLRCYVDYQQDDWLSLLPSAEYACNSHVNASTGKVPFEVVLRYSPQFRTQPALQEPVRNKDNPAARELAEKIDDGIKEGKNLWEDAQKAMSKYYNKKHKERTYQEGEKVMLSAKNIRMRKASKKLTDRYIGPFTILEAVGKNAYRLDLPKHYRIHPTFHVSLLERYRRREGAATPEPIEIEGEEWWEVERILDEAKVHGKRKFLVRWKGFTAADDTWEPEENLSKEVPALIHEFREQRRRAGEARAKSRRGGDEESR